MGNLSLRPGLCFAGLGVGTQGSPVLHGYTISLRIIFGDVPGSFN